MQKQAHGKTSLVSQWGEETNQREIFLAKVGYDAGAQLVRCPEPSHEDNNPSAQANDGCIHCHACGESWSYLDAYRLMTGQNHRDAAADLLGQPVGTPQTSTASSVSTTMDKAGLATDRQKEKKSQAYAKLQTDRNLAQEAWHKTKPYANHDLDYFANRGITRPNTTDIRYADTFHLDVGDGKKVAWNGPVVLVFRRNAQAELTGAECIMLNADHTNATWKTGGKMGKNRKQQIGGRHNDGAFLRRRDGNKTVMIGEGAENTLSLGMAADEGVDFFTCFGAPNMDNATEILSSYECIQIASDNDAAGIKAAQETAAKLYDAGVKRVIEFRSPCEKQDWNDLLRNPEGGPEFMLSHFQAGGVVIAKMETGLDVYDADGIDEITLPTKSIDFVDGWLVEESLACVYAKPNDGKTFWTLDLATSVAMAALDPTGYGLWRGEIEVKGGAVGYLATEGNRGARLRLSALMQSGKAKKGCPLFSLNAPEFDLLDAEKVGKVIRTANHQAERRGYPLRLIIIDTLASSMVGADENSSQMGEAVQALKRIKDETGACVLVVHHAGKDITKGLRGHSSLNGALDTVIEIKAATELVEGSEGQQKTIVAKVTKHRDLEYPKPIKSVLRVVELGIDDRNKKITSCVVDAVAYEHKEKEAATKPPTSQKIKEAMAFVGDGTSANIKDVAQHCGVSERSIRKWVNESYTLENVRGMIRNKPTESWSPA